MKKLEVHLAEKMEWSGTFGHLMVNGPLPADFAERFAQSVSQASGVDTKEIKLTGKQNVEEAPGVVEIGFQAPPKVVKLVENEAADPNSDLAKGNLHSFLVAKEDADPAPKAKAGAAPA